MKKIILVLIVVGLLGWSMVFFNMTRAVEGGVVFDHNLCQYPNRLSNPPNGCDNSDIACPEEIKGGNCVTNTPNEAIPAPPILAPVQQETVVIQPSTCFN
jgi:hypothetical protein